MIEQAKFTYSPLENVSEKQTNHLKIKEKQIETLKPLKPKGNHELKSIERLFQKRKKEKEREIMKLKMKKMKLKHRKIKLNQKI